MQVFEEGVPCVSPSRVDRNLRFVTDFVATRDGLGELPFWRAICALQSPEVALGRMQGGGPRLVWDWYEAEGVSPVLRDLMAVEAIDPGCAYTCEERRHCHRVVKSGLRWLRRMFPDTFPVFRDAVPFLVLARKSGHVSGSVSSRIGFVWLAPRREWSAQECGEHLFHEYVHQCLFLEDMVRTLFSREPGAMEEPRDLIVSALRGLPRRYDQSYHSAFVAAAIIEYRARASNLEGARALFAMLWPCMDALATRRHFLTENGEEQLDRLIDCVLRQADALGVIPRDFPAAP